MESNKTKNDFFNKFEIKVVNLDTLRDTCSRLRSGVDKIGRSDDLALIVWLHHQNLTLFRRELNDNYDEQSRQLGAKRVEWNGFSPAKHLSEEGDQLLIYGVRVFLKPWRNDQQDPELMVSTSQLLNLPLSIPLTILER